MSNDDNKYGVVISADCGSFKTHDPHIITKGFFGIGRRECEGYTHRHFWQLDPISLGPGLANRFMFTVNWKCYCGEHQSISRIGFYSELMGKKWRSL